MKKVLLVIIVLAQGILMPVHAQTFSEWFRQKKTQKKYLVQQIALLQVYLGYLKKGYAIVNEGVTTVRQIRNAEFDLHDLFYTSIQQVNPKIKQYNKAAAILANQQYILSTYRSTIKAARGSPYTPISEADWIYATCQNFLADVAGIVDELIAVLADGKLSLTDDERINRVDRLYEKSKQQVVFMQQLATDASMLRAQRQKEQSEIDYVLKQYQLK